MGAALTLARRVLLVIAAGLTACAPPRAPVAPGESAPSSGAGPAAAGEASWREWGVPAFDEARAARRPVLLVLSRQAQPRDRELVAAAADGEAAPARRWQAAAVLVHADADELPELADFAELAATVFQRERGYPLAVLMTPEGVPLGVAADAGFPGEIDDLLVQHAALPALRLADAPSLQSLRRAQEPMKATRSLTREASVRRAQGLAAARTHGLSRAGLLLLLEAHDVLQAAPLGAAAARALAAGGRSAPPGLEAAAWTLWGSARVGESAQALALAQAVVASLAEPTGVFRAAADDPRVFTGANGLMIAGLAAAGATDPALRAAEALLARAGPAQNLRRGYDGDRMFGPARLDDYAGLGLGLVALHEATGDARWLREAETVADAAVAALWDNAAGGFFLHPQPIAPLPVRIRNGFDGERPSPNALMALLLTDLGQRLRRPQLRDLARRTVEAFAGEIERAPSGADGLHAAALRVLPAAPPPEVTPPPAFPSRLVRGAVTLEARLDHSPVRAGERARVQVEIRTIEGWSVTPHRPADRGAVPLTIAVLDPELGAGPAVYLGTSERTVNAMVPLRIPQDAAAGRRQVRVSVRFEPCAASGACQAPERVTLGVPLTIAP